MCSKDIENLLSAPISSGCKTAWNMRCSRLISVCVCVCEFDVRQVMSLQNVISNTHIFIYCTVDMYNTHMYVCKYGETTFFQYFSGWWNVQNHPPNRSEAANGKSLRLQTWQRSNSIVYQPSFLQIKSTKAGRNDINWYEDTNSSPKWYFEPLSWCFFSGRKHTRVSDHVFSTTWCGGIRCSNTFGNAENFKGSMFWDIP